VIGKARLNGFNGMQGMSPLNIPWFGRPIDLEATALYIGGPALLLLDEHSEGVQPSIV
jgi:urea transport system permease protein